MLPYPVLSLSLLVMWLLLNGFTVGHLILGIFVAVFASWAMASLRPQKPRLVKWYLLPKLFLVVLYDILKSKRIELFHNLIAVGFFTANDFKDATFQNPF